MYEQLASIMRKLTAEEFDVCKTFFIQRKYEKTNFAIRGDVCTYIID
jgi:hypothetical protein